VAIYNPIQRNSICSDIKNSGVATLGPAGAQPHHRVFEPHHPDFKVTKLLNRNK